MKKYSVVAKGKLMDAVFRTFDVQANGTGITLVQWAKVFQIKGGKTALYFWMGKCE